MDDLTPRRDEVVLRREVEAPLQQPTGLGVMLLASAAMFFAVAGSAFILRAQMAPRHCPYRVEHAVVEQNATGSDCQVRSPVAPDGSQVIEFRLCPDGP